MTHQRLPLSGQGPLYEQIRSAIAEPIVAGRWLPGRRIPSEMELTKDFRASRMTVNRALTSLAADGLIVRWRRRGSFVARRAVELAVFEVWDIAAEITRSGRAYGYELLERKLLAADGERAKAMGLATGAPLIEICCRHRADGIVVQLEQRLINLAAVPHAASEMFAEIGPGRWLLDQVPWGQAEHVIRAEATDTITAGLMGVAAGTACLVIERRTRRAGTTITLSRLLHPGDRHALTGRPRPLAPAVTCKPATALPSATARRR
jgi:GntR family transcriptional regulator, histidine utilization repressor